MCLGCRMAGAHLIRRDAEFAFENPAEMRTGVETGAKRQFGNRADPGFRRHEQRSAELQPGI